MGSTRTSESFAKMSGLKGKADCARRSRVLFVARNVHRVSGSSRLEAFSKTLRAGNELLDSQAFLCVARP
ncbi:hypothetical protein SuNHUV7_22470 (plasmid) [Pseudoseohaeicola sp. NH-UV-7]